MTGQLSVCAHTYLCIYIISNFLLRWPFGLSITAPPLASSLCLHLRYTHGVHNQICSSLSIGDSVYLVHGAWVVHH